MIGWRQPLGEWEDPPPTVIAIIAAKNFPEEEARAVARSAIRKFGAYWVWLLRAGHGAPAVIREEFEAADIEYLEIAPNRQYWVSINQKGEVVKSSRHSDSWFFGELRQTCGRVVYLHTGKSKPPMVECDRVKIITKEREE